MKTTRHLLAGIFLLSAGTLALEVALTRLFSMTLWYHFACLAISLALIGSATAGVVLVRCACWPHATRRPACPTWSRA